MPGTSQLDAGVVNLCSIQSMIEELDLIDD